MVYLHGYIMGYTESTVEVAKEWGKGMLAIKYWKKRKVHHSRDEYGIFGGFHFFHLIIIKWGKKSMLMHIPFHSKQSVHCGFMLEGNLTDILYVYC